MKQAHRAVIIAALAGAGLLVGNMGFGAGDYMEHQVKEKRYRTQLSQKTTKTKNIRKQKGIDV